MDKDRLKHMKIYAPFAGVVRFLVADGQHVTTGDELAIVEAAKLEAPVLAPGPGLVVRSQHEDFVDVHGGDELLSIAALANSQTTQHTKTDT